MRLVHPSASTATAVSLAALWLVSQQPSLAQMPVASSWDEHATVRLWVAPAANRSARWFPEKIVERLAEVETWDAKQLSGLDRVTGDDFAVPAERVIWLEPIQWPEPERVAWEQFQSARYAESLPLLLEAVSARPPIWRQQWLSAVAAQAAMRSGRYKIALELVSQLDRRSLPPVVLGWMPVIWESHVNDAAMQTAALERLAEGSPATRLVAASWLLSSPSRAEAAGVLRSLAGDDQRPEVARLARVLLWQLVPPPEVQAALENWIAELDALPMALQTGPTLTLIGALRSSGNGESAERFAKGLQLTPIHPHPDLAADE